MQSVRMLVFIKHVFYAVALFIDNIEFKKTDLRLQKYGVKL
jgi:hypothetical protein